MLFWVPQLLLVELRGEKKQKRFWFLIQFVGRQWLVASQPQMKAIMETERQKPSSTDREIVARKRHFTGT